MAIKIIDGNLFDSKAKIICHQVNCQGVMGSGVAAEVKRRYPHVYEEYKKICTSDMLGWTQLVPIDNGRYVCNMFSQNKYGYDGKQYTSLGAIRHCFECVKNYILTKEGLHGATIAMPYKIGCVRGGADWNKVYQIIEEVLGDCDVELWRLDKG